MKGTVVDINTPDDPQELVMLALGAAGLYELLIGTRAVDDEDYMQQADVLDGLVYKLYRMQEEVSPDAVGVLIGARRRVNDVVRKLRAKLRRN